MLARINCRQILTKQATGEAACLIDHLRRYPTFALAYFVGFLYAHASQNTVALLQLQVSASLSVMSSAYMCLSYASATSST